MSYDVTIAASDELFKGEHKIIQYTVYVNGSTDAAIQAGTATPQDITGWTLRWRLNDGTGATQVSKTSGSGISITNAAAGILLVTINAADTSGLTAGTFHFILDRTDVGSEAVLARGPVTLQDP